MNTDIKKGFVEHITEITEEGKCYDTIRALKNTLKYTAKYEERYNKDAAFFTFDEAIEMYKERKYINHYTYLHENKFLSDYTDYYISQTGEKSENVYKGISTSILRQCVYRDPYDNRYLTRDQMQEIVDQLINENEKAIVLLLWDGVQIDDILYLSEDQVDYDQQIINVEGKIYHISEETCRVLPKAFRETTKQSYRSRAIRNVTGAGEVYKRARNARGEDSYAKRHDWLYHMMSIIREVMDIPYFTPEQIRDSAMLCDFREAVQQTGKPLQDIITSKIGERIIKKYSDQMISRFVQKEMYERFNIYI